MLPSKMAIRKTAIIILLLILFRSLYGSFVENKTAIIRKG